METHLAAVGHCPRPCSARPIARGAIPGFPDTGAGLDGLGDLRPARPRPGGFGRPDPARSGPDRLVGRARPPGVQQTGDRPPRHPAGEPPFQLADRGIPEPHEPGTGSRQQLGEPTADHAVLRGKCRIWVWHRQLCGFSGCDLPSATNIEACPRAEVPPPVIPGTSGCAGSNGSSPHCWPLRKPRDHEPLDRRGRADRPLHPHSG